MLLIRFLHKICYYFISVYVVNFIDAINSSFVNTTVKNEIETNFDFTSTKTEIKYHHVIAPRNIFDFICQKLLPLNLKAFALIDADIEPDL